MGPPSPACVDIERRFLSSTAFFYVIYINFVGVAHVQKAGKAANNFKGSGKRKYSRKLIVKKGSADLLSEEVKDRAVCLYMLLLESGGVDGPPTRAYLVHERSKTTENLEKGARDPGIWPWGHSMTGMRCQLQTTRARARHKLNPILSPAIYFHMQQTSTADSSIYPLGCMSKFGLQLFAANNHILHFKQSLQAW